MTQPDNIELEVVEKLSPFLDQIIQGDCRDKIPLLPADSVDLIVTSPPYADKRNQTYGGVKPNEYVDWFLPITQELQRVLKPTGSFILNIKEPVLNGERHTFVIELILELRKQGWLWVEEYCWHKKNCYPGKWPNRFRDAWERCFHFTLNKKFAMYQEAVMVPMGDWKNKRLSKLSETDKQRDNSKVGSGFGKNVSNWVERDMAYPTNVLHLATECSNRGHSYGRAGSEASSQRIYTVRSGQAFWEEIAGDVAFYLKLIWLIKDSPIQHRPDYQTPTSDTAVSV